MRYRIENFTVNVEINCLLKQRWSGGEGQKKTCCQEARRRKEKKSSLQDGKLWRRPSSGTPVLCFTEVIFFNLICLRIFSCPGTSMYLCCDVKTKRYKETKKQGRKLGRCDSYLRNLKLSLTDPLDILCCLDWIDSAEHLFLSTRIPELVCACFAEDPKTRLNSPWQFLLNPDLT